VTDTKLADEDIMEATAVEPDRTLRNLVGPQTVLTSIFSREKIEACQKTIDEARDTFFDTAREELAQLEALAAAPPGDESWFESAAAHAGNIKGHAEMFGYHLVVSICQHIVGYGEPSPHTPVVRRLLIIDLIKMLHLAVAEKIIDHNGILGQKLLASLRKY
jgi:hypothetical protein